MRIGSAYIDTSKSGTEKVKKERKNTRYLEQLETDLSRYEDHFYSVYGGLARTLSVEDILDDLHHLPESETESSEIADILADRRNRAKKRALRDEFRRRQDERRTAVT